MLSTRIVRRAMSARSMSSLAARFDESVEALPNREAARYTRKNMKWQASDFKKYTDCQARAFLEMGITKGDVLAIMLPDSAEKHIAMLAATKIGAVVAEVVEPFPSSHIGLRNALVAVSPRAVIFEPVTATGDNLKLVRKAVPELVSYNDTFGKPFHSKILPTLKYVIHTGFDLETGMFNYKHAFVYDAMSPEKDTVPPAAAAVRDDAPAYIQVKVDANDNATATAPVTQAQLLDASKAPASWSFLHKLMSREHFEAL